jgi:hypothetical protein
MSNVYRFLHPSSPVTSAALVALMSFSKGSANDAPESVHDVVAENNITFVFVVLPPTRTA